MWRSSFLLLKEGLSSAIVRSKPVPFGLKRVVSVESNYRFCGCLFSSSVGGDGGGDGGGGVNGGDSMSFAEAKKLMRLVNVEALKVKLGTEGKEVISYPELLQACKNIGLARSVGEAKAFADVLDEAGVVLIFRHKVYLHPDKVVDLVRRAVPLALTADDDPRRDELKKLQAKQEEINRLAKRQVRRILWTGLGLALGQIGLFFPADFLGILLGCYGAHCFLCYNIWADSGLCLLSHHIEGPNLPRSYAEAIPLTSKKAHEEA